MHTHTRFMHAHWSEDTHRSRLYIYIEVMNTLPLTQFTPRCHTRRYSSDSVLSGRAITTGSGRLCIQSLLNSVMAATQVPTAQATGPLPAVNDEDVIIILHQQQTMHVAHNITNTIYTFSEGTQKGSLCTYSALCSITCCMNPQLGNSTCVWTGLGLTHTQEHTAQREVGGWVYSQRKEVMGTEFIATSFTDVHTECVR